MPRQLAEVDRFDLEKLIDAHGLRNVMYALAHICREKSDHVIETWGDKALARLWEIAANRIDVCTNSTAIQRLP